MKRSRMSGDDILLTLGFRGGNKLGTRAMPIYELGTCLISLQRMIHKSYLEREASAGNRAVMDVATRTRMALQIGRRRQGSDIYELVSFFATPEMAVVIAAILGPVLGALAPYIYKDVVKYLREDSRSNETVPKSEPSELLPTDMKVVERAADASPLSIEVYNEIRIISDRIGNVAGVETIEILPGKAVTGPKIEINRDTHKYLLEIEDVVVAGDRQKIQGRVLTWDLRKQTVDIQRVNAGQCKVFLNASDFHPVRYKAPPYALIVFEGRSLFVMGSNMRRFNRFKADKITIKSN